VLLIKNYLDKSPTHGIGLFAGEPIAKDALVWEFNPKVDLEITPEAWAELANSVAAPCFAELRKYAYKEDGRHYICIDNAQFMNHSLDHCNVGNSGCGRYMTASRQIEANEELLCNYFEFCDDDDFNIQCMKAEK